MRSEKHCFHANLLFASAICILSLTGCLKDHVTRTYTIYRPVYSAKSTVLAHLNGNPSQPFDTIGKIYVKDRYILLGEKNKGIHIIDNSDPMHPSQVAFLNIPGNQDMAIKGNTLYADMYRDLLAIDISNPAQARVTGSTPSLFQIGTYFNGIIWYSKDGILGDSSQVITGWTVKDTTVDVKPGPEIYLTSGGICSNCGIYYTSNGTTPANSGASSSPGMGGSMAKITLVGNYLYALISSYKMGIIDVSNPAQPGKPIIPAPAMSFIETIFPFEDKLFIGSTQGVFIYSIDNPTSPKPLGQFRHGKACDPVIADGKYAYVTLRTGTTCGGASNELDVLDITDLLNPNLLATYPMTGPQGLSKDNNQLFVCDGPGVKIYDATNPASLQLQTTLNTGTAYDVIAFSGHLFVTATNGLYQYDYSNPQDIRQLSFYPVKFH